MTGQSVGKAARCTDTGTGAYLCLVTEETEEPAVTTSSTWRVAEELGGGEFEALLAVLPVSTTPLSATLGPVLSLPHSGRHEQRNRTW